MKTKSIFVLTIIALCSSFSLGARADELFGNVDINGDLRYRLETIDQEYEMSRHRHRIRGRLNFTGEVSSDLNIVIGLGTGSSDDPVSNNQTLGDGFSSKPLWLDLAYFDYSPFNGGNFYAGKIKNPFKSVGKTELVWDSDFNPEGLALRLEPKLDIVKPFIRGSFFWAEEKKSDDDYFIIGSEFGLNVKTGKHSYIIAGGRYIDYRLIESSQVLWDSRDSFGNSAFDDSDGELYYIYDYNLLGEFVEVGGDISGVNWSVFADYVANEAVRVNNKAWLVGVSLGKCKKAFDICSRYIYREVGKDAVVGLFSDSDFAGGNTDSKGHEFNLGTNVSDNIETKVSYFNNEFGDLSVNYQRVQVDLSASF